MYPIERYIKILKGYIKNQNRPEGCIIKWHIWRGSWILQWVLIKCWNYIWLSKRVCTKEQMATVKLALV